MNALTDSLTLTESPDLYGAYPRLSDDQIGVLSAVGDRRPVLGDLILRAFIMRRSILIGLGAGFRIVGSRSPDTHRLRDLAIRNRVPHHCVDLEEDPGAEEMLRRLSVQPSEAPIVLLGPSKVLRNPSNVELARALGLRREIEHKHQLTAGCAGIPRSPRVCVAGPARSSWYARSGEACCSRRS